MLKTAGWAFRLGTALPALMLAPVFFFLIAEGRLNFGGREKDIILVVPAALWALLSSGAILLLTFLAPAFLGTS